MEPVSSEIQAGYDKVAAAYAQAFINEQDKKPMDREMLQRFALETKGKGMACDMGCGPGQIAAYLVDHCGLNSVMGMDLSPRFIEEAQKLHPHIPFRQGNMLSIDEKDNAWAGITAFYCLIHIPHTQIVDALKEMLRVLIPGGVLLLTFHIGSEIVHVDKFFDEQVCMDFVFFEPQEMEGYLRAAGFERIETTVRQPYAPEVEHQSRRAYIFAYKPGIDG
jgi:ubiquinone/menaquinone biosynthesis C-methylase UbiE